ncbi:G-protein coupled receptor 54-like [Diadema setosum]|uniref:G-protein coupled receptor 54-like n=1 Tax=Diadema setosum TaxID=31175 RepID=UPI003B3B4576
MNMTSTAVIETVSFVDFPNETGHEVDDGGYSGGHGGHGYPIIPEIALVILRFVKIFVDSVGIVGNTAVIILVVFCRDLRTTANYHFLNMALADVVLLLENILTQISYLINYDIFSSWMCVPNYLHTMTVQTSSLTLSALSIDRYKLIVHPLKNLQERTTMSVLSSLVGVWLLSLLLHAPVQIFSTRVGKYCMTLLPWKHGSLVYKIYTLLVLFVIPVLIVSFCNYQIARKLRRKRPGMSHGTSVVTSAALFQRTHDVAVSNADVEFRPPASEPAVPSDAKPSAAKKPGRARSMRLVITVALLYIMLYLPFYAFYAASIIPNALPRKLYYEGHVYASLLLLINSAINPYIYVLIGGNFRRQICQLLPCLRRKKTADNKYIDDCSKQNQFSNGITNTTSPDLEKSE